MAFVIPPTVPVNVGLAIGAFAFIAVLFSANAPSTVVAVISESLSVINTSVAV